MNSIRDRGTKQVLRAPSDHVETDKRDAQGLARLLSLGEVTEVHIPTESQEALRDLYRARIQTQKALAHHQRQQLNALFLHHGR